MKPMGGLREPFGIICPQNSTCGHFSGEGTKISPDS